MILVFMGGILEEPAMNTKFLYKEGWLDESYFIST